MQYHKKETNPVCWLQITAGQGPKECGWVVAQVYKRIVEEAEEAKLNVQLVESLAFDKLLRKQSLIEPDAYRSVLLRIEGTASPEFSERWCGAIKWQGESALRAKHKRLNWFVGVAPVVIPKNNATAFNTLQRECEFDTMRASGPGGQHVNKTDSAVRVKHKPTGLTVRVESERSQHRNKHIALERLQLLLQGAAQQDAKALEQQRWLSHYQVQRGNAKRVFTGQEFKER
ncbi:MAG: peptide chain release factor H [Pseudomonadales bacterium]|nr:peptide chain release factor H [Pseudomonadales bacterium]